MNQKYQEASVELNSTQLINNMLREEIKTLRSQREDVKTFIKKPIGGQCSGDVSAQETFDSKQKQFSLNGDNVSNKEGIET